MANSGNDDSSQSDYSPRVEKSPNPDSPGLSGFSLNLNEDGPSSGGSQRPMGIKKAKRKIKANEENSKALSTMANCSERMLIMMQNAEISRQELINIEKERNSISARREENKVLRMNPMCFDESLRPYLIEEQRKIFQKRAARDEADGSSGEFGRFFNGTSPSDSDFPPY